MNVMGRVSGESGGWKERCENVVAIVERGGKWGALKASGEERRWSEGRWWKEGGELDGGGVRTRARRAIICRDSLVEGGRNVKEPRGFELRWPGPFTLTDAAGKVGKVLEEGKKVFAQPPKRFNDAR